MTFQNRTEAGEKLAIKLSGCLSRPLRRTEASRQAGQAVKDLVVLAIPRGGVVVGKKLAERLDCPLDVIVTKKIGAPRNPELAIGAIGPEGEEVIDEELAEKVGADKDYIKKQVARIRSTVIKKRAQKYRGDRPPLDLKGKTIILVDDGVATGATMLAAIEVARQHDPKKIIVAVPVMAQDSLGKIEKLADEVVYLDAPRLFFAVGQFYREFEQVADDEVIEILKTENKKT